MKFTKTANGMKLSISRKDWITLGQSAGFLGKTQAPSRFSFEHVLLSGSLITDEGDEPERKVTVYYDCEPYEPMTKDSPGSVGGCWVEAVHDAVTNEDITSLVKPDVIKQLMKDKQRDQ